MRDCHHLFHRITPRRRCLSILIIKYFSSLSRRAPMSELKTFDLQGLGKVFGILVFSPAAHAFFPDIQRRMREPELFPVCLRRAYGLAAILYLLVGLAGPLSSRGLSCFISTLRYYYYYYHYSILFYYCYSLNQQDMCSSAHRRNPAPSRMWAGPVNFSFSTSKGCRCRRFRGRCQSCTGWPPLPRSVCLFAS